MAFATSTDLARRVVEILGKVRMEPIVIMRYSKPVAVLVPYDPDEHAGIRLLHFQDLPSVSTEGEQRVHSQS